jgi:hypothetical protein
MPSDNLINITTRITELAKKCNIAVPGVNSPTHDVNACHLVSYKGFEIDEKSNTTSTSTTTSPYNGMSILLDTREHGLRDLLRLPFVTVCTMNPGDIAIVYKGKLLVVYERKTHSDLISSIYKGRYKAQRDRLKRLNDGNPPVVCLIYERPVGTQVINTEEVTVSGSETNCILRDNFRWRRSDSMRHTAYLVLRDFYYLLQSYSIDLKLQAINTAPAGLVRVAPVLDVASTTCVVDTSSTMFVPTGSFYRGGRPSRNITAENLLVLHLGCIPGVSEECARGIQLKFCNLKALTNGLEVPATRSGRIDLLSELTYVTKKGSAAKVGPSLARKIISLLGY